MLTVKKSLPSRDKKGRRNQNFPFARINLINRSFSSKKLSRQFPLISGIHNAVDGALIGVVISVALMSTLALHWRHLWIVAFTQLESSRDLSHRLIDSTAMLERNLLSIKSFPITMVPTKAKNLIYLEKPLSRESNKKDNRNFFNSFEEITYSPIFQGY